MERRFIKGGYVRAKQGDKPGIEGVAAVYNQTYDTGWFSETIAAGAFSRALKEKQDVRCLFNHDVNQLLGRTRSGTLTMEDSSEGLKYACDTDPNTSVGRDVPAMIQRGDIDGCSFSFNVRKDTWSDEFDENGRYVTSHRQIDDLDLFDVGPVTFPAYTETSVGIRSQWPDGVPAERRSHIETLRQASEVPQGAKRDAECQCSCEACKAGNCEDCSVSDCDEPGCLCDAAQDRALQLRARPYTQNGLHLVA